jgi:protein-disulfide isomerase
MLHNGGRVRYPRHHRRPPLSGNKTTPPTTRKERRAAERQNRFEAERAARKSSTSGSGGGSSWINTRTMTVVGIVAGILIVVLVAANQLGGRVTGQLDDPGFQYPAELQDGMTLGSADAPVVMEVYSDFQCPVCAKHALDVEPSLVNKYVAQGQVQVVHHDINLLGRGTDESLIPALGGYCANEQDKYWDYSHWIYNNQDGENQGGFSKERVTRIAVAAGVEEAAFTSCIDSQPALDFVNNITDVATSQLGINSTPTIYLNGTQYVGLKPSSDWSLLIDAELAKSSAPAGSPAASSAP